MASSNVIIQDTTKNFWDASSFSNLTSKIQSSIDSLQTYGDYNIVGLGNNKISLVDPLNDSIVEYNMDTENSDLNFSVFDGKSFSMFSKASQNAYRFYVNQQGTFSPIDILLAPKLDTLNGFAFDGRYLYTLSDNVYTVDTTSTTQYTANLWQSNTSTVSGFFDGRYMTMYNTTNVCSRTDLIPYTQNNNCLASAIVNYAYLSEKENEWMKGGPLDYVVTQVQQSTINDGYYNVNFLNPVKELIMTGPLDSFRVYFNGNLNTDPDKRYMSNISQLFYHSRMATYQNTYAVSFSNAPEKNIPSGHVNMSRIIEKVFASKTRGPVNIFALSHNILRVRDGIGGLIFNSNFN